MICHNAFLFIPMLSQIVYNNLIMHKSCINEKHKDKYEYSHNIHTLIKRITVIILSVIVIFVFMHCSGIYIDMF